MKLSFALLAAIGVAGLTQMAWAADITGTVTLSAGTHVLTIKPQHMNGAVMNLRTLTLTKASQ